MFCPFRPPCYTASVLVELTEVERSKTLEHEETIVVGPSCGYLCGDGVAFGVAATHRGVFGSSARSHHRCCMGHQHSPAATSPLPEFHARGFEARARLCLRWRDHSRSRLLPA